MVALTASGEIFSLKLEGGVALDEWIRLAGGARLRSDVTAELNVCHGVSASAGAQVIAEAQARLGALWVLAASGDADASAQARAFAKGTFSGNIFEEFGAALSVGAEASVSASAQAAAGLDVAGIATLAELALDTTADALALDLFYAFLNEVRIEGGAKAEAIAGAAAFATAAVAGNFMEEPSRFQILLEAGAAPGVGGAAAAFFRCELDNPKRMATNCAELIAAEIAAAARANLPVDAHGLIQYVELLVPIAFCAAWDLAELTTLDSLGAPEAYAGRLIRVVAGQLQRWVLDRAVELGLEAASQWLADILVSASLGGVRQAEREQLADQLDAIADGLPTQPISLARLGEAATDVVLAVTDIVGAEPAAALRRPLALAWTAAAAVIAVRDPLASGLISTSVVGVGPVDLLSGEVLAIPTPPSFVRAEWTAVLGRSVGSEVHFSDCVDVLLGMGLGDQLARVEHLGPLLADLTERLDLTIGDFVEAALVAAVGRGLQRTDLYRRFRDLIAEGIHEVIVDQIIPSLRAALPAGNPTLRWIDEAVAPCLLAVGHFGLDRLDALVGGSLSGDLSPFLNRLRTLFGVLCAKLVLRNVEVLASVLIDHVLDELPGELRRLAADIDAGADLDVTARWAAIAATLIPAALAPVLALLSPDEMAAASRRLLAGLFDTSAAALEVYTPARRRQLQLLQQRAWRIDDLAVNYADNDSVEQFVDNIFDCSFVPDPAAVVDLAELELVIIAEQLAVTVPSTVGLLTEFCATVAGPEVNSVRRDLADAIVSFGQGILEAERRVAAFDTAFRNAAGDVDRALAGYSASLRAAERALRSRATRELVIADIRSAARARAIALLGDGTGNVAFDGAWATLGWTVDPALDVLGTATGWLADAVGGARNAVAAAAAVEAELARQTRAALLGVDLGELARFLGVEDIVNAMVGAARQPTVTSQINMAMSAQTDQTTAEERRRAAGFDRAKAAASKASQEKARAAASQPITVSIIHPPAVAGNRLDLHVHAGSVALRVLLGGAEGQLPATLAPRLRVFLNGAPLVLTSQDLTLVAGREMRRTLTRDDGLRLGVNVVECSVAQPPSRRSPVGPRQPERTTRQTVTFAWQPAPRRDPRVRTDPGPPRLPPQRP